MADEETKEPDCIDCINAVSRVEVRMASFEEQMRLFNSNLMKMFYALIGIIAANVGTKYIGTPVYVYLAVYLSIVAATFVLLVTITRWRFFSFWEKWIRLAFVGHVFFVSAARIFHYQAETALTQAEGVAANLLSIMLAIGFLALAWQRDQKLQQDQLSQQQQ